MYTRLIYLFLIQYSFAASVSEMELRRFAFSKTWLNLYVYQKTLFTESGYKSKATEDKFFFSSDGKINPFKELKAAIVAFNDTNKWGHINKQAACAFPARFQILKKKFPILFKKEVKCTELDEWLQSIAAQEVSFVYAGPYPNNPASMFGHSFLRFHKKNSSELFDYVVGFRATVNPQDNPIAYTIKGMMGGYQGYYNMAPFYLNVGLYNNQEGRDLWNYKIKLTNEELLLLQKHIWELMFNTSYSYYFLDENCSYYLLTLLDAIRPELNLIEKQDLIVHPIETIKDAIDATNSSKQFSSFRASIKKKIHTKVNSMNSDQYNSFLDIIKSEKSGELSNDILVLDTLIDYTKFQNYLSATQTDKTFKEKHKSILKKRATIKDKNSYKRINSKASPVNNHAPSKLFVSYDRDKDTDRMSIKSIWGHHNKTDSEEGFSRWAFIDFFGLKYSFLGNGLRSNKARLENIYLVEINSLENYDRLFSSLSWRVHFEVKRNCYFCKDQMSLASNGGIGLSKGEESYVLWTYLTLENISQFKHQYTYPSLNIGGKYKVGILNLVSDSWGFYRNDEIILEVNTSASVYLFSETALEFSHAWRSPDNYWQYSVGLKRHF